MLIIIDIFVFDRQMTPESLLRGTPANAVVSNLARARSSLSLQKLALNAVVARAGGIEECPCKVQFKERMSQNMRILRWGLAAVWSRAIGRQRRALAALAVRPLECHSQSKWGC